jgi:hypothetical protein
MFPDKPRRRVHGHHDRRMDGLHDLVVRAPGASVLDIGMNRGLNAYEMMDAGARLVHGMELDPHCVDFARTLFVELDPVSCQSQFEVGDLTQGISCLAPLGYGGSGWDIVLMIAVYHKLKRPPSKAYADLGASHMSPEDLSQLMTDIGRRTNKYFGFRGDRGELVDLPQIDQDMERAGLERIATNAISELGPTAIYRRARLV